MKNGAVYIRVSTDDQVEYSPDAQLKKIKEYAQKNNILITKEFIYIENGVSGRSVAKREQFKKMIATAKSKPKPFDVVLVHAYDRFARNVKESRIYKELLRNDLGIELISVTEDFGNDKNSFLMEGIKDILNEYYSLNLRDEVLKGMNEKVSRGEINGSARLGYDVINGKLQINQEEANIVKLIFNMYATNYNYMDIAKHINSLGIKTKRGNKFETRTIKYILRNPVYIGKLRWSGNGKTNYVKHDSNSKTNFIDGIHEPIIDIEVWNKVQEKADMNAIFAKPHQCSTVKTWHWLKGLIRCADCGHTYIKHNKKYMRCNGYNKSICINHFEIVIKDFEEIILNQIKEDFIGKVNVKFKVTKTQNHIEKDIIKKQLKQLELKKERIKESYIAGIDSLEEYKVNKNMIENEYKLIKESLAAFKEDDTIDIKSKKIQAENVYKLLKDDNISMDIKKIAVHNLIDRIEISPEKQEISIVYNI